MITACIVI